MTTDTGRQKKYISIYRFVKGLLGFEDDGNGVDAISERITCLPFGGGVEERKIGSVDEVHHVGHWPEVGMRWREKGREQAE